MRRLGFTVALILSLGLIGCQSSAEFGESEGEGDGAGAGMVAETNHPADMTPEVSQSEIEKFALVRVKAEEDGVSTEHDLNSVEPYLEQVELSEDRFIQIRREMQDDGQLYNSIVEKEQELRAERSD